VLVEVCVYKEERKEERVKKEGAGRSGEGRGE
jgi:hypothetical protein